MRTATSDRQSDPGAADPLRPGKPTPKDDPDPPTGEVVRRLMHTYLAAARGHEAGIVADSDPESLHDYRVNLRKVRSILSLCKKQVCHPDEAARLKHMLATVMQPTNRLRDLDVYLLAQSHYLSFVAEDLRAGLEMMFAAFAAERRQQFGQVTAMLRSASYTETMTAVAQQIDAPQLLETGPQTHVPAGVFARDLIRKRYAKVCKLAGQMTADTPENAVHAVRIQCKKLRYALEFFRPFFPDHALNDRMKDLKHVQDNLGRFNDYAVQQRELQAFLLTASRRQPEARALSASIAALMTVLHHRQETERQQMLANFQRFGSAEMQAAFADLAGVVRRPV